MKTPQLARAEIGSIARRADFHAVRLRRHEFSERYLHNTAGSPVQNQACPRDCNINNISVFVQVPAQPEAKGDQPVPKALTRSARIAAAAFGIYRLLMHVPKTPLACTCWRS